MTDPSLFPPLGQAAEAPGPPPGAGVAQRRGRAIRQRTAPSGAPASTGGEAAVPSPAPDWAPVPGQDNVLEFDAVCASYGTYRALFSVSFAVPRGGKVALLGSNGAGKSTVARVASGSSR